jgi:hypothetical protein
MSAAAAPSNRYHKGDERARRGWARMRQLAAQDAIAITELTSELLAGLGRPPGAIDRASAEAISACIVRGRRLRESGRSDLEERRQLAQLLRASGGAFKPSPPAEAKPIETPLEYAKRVAAERAAAAAADSEAAQ